MNALLRVIEGRLRPGTLCRCSSALAAGALAIAVLTVPAHGFAIREGLTNNTPNDASDDLQDAARWTHLPESLVRDGVRGLGGGVEYSLAPEFCERIIPRFADDPPPSCEQLRADIQRGLDRWIERHPFLSFTDVSREIDVSMPSAGEAEPWRGHGAELDVYAMSDDEYSTRAYPDALPLRGRASRTRLWAAPRPPLGTNGRIMPGRVTTGVDHILSLTVCYYRDGAQASAQLDGRGCNHWESMVVFMGGRALGLGNPNLDPGRLFDSDDDPTNRIPIDCEEPTRGLRLTTAFDPNAIMIANVGVPRPVQLSLAPDDRAGRDFLYPVCPGYG